MSPAIQSPRIRIILPRQTMSGGSTQGGNELSPVAIGGVVLGVIVLLLVVGRCIYVLVRNPDEQPTPEAKSEGGSPSTDLTAQDTNPMDSEEPRSTGTEPQKEEKSPEEKIADTFEFCGNCSTGLGGIGVEGGGAERFLTLYLLNMWARWPPLSPIFPPKKGMSAQTSAHSAAISLHPNSSWPGSNVETTQASETTSDEGWAAAQRREMHALHIGIHPNAISRTACSPYANHMVMLVFPTMHRAPLDCVPGTNLHKSTPAPVGTQKKSTVKKEKIGHVKEEAGEKKRIVAAGKEASTHDPHEGKSCKTPLYAEPSPNGGVVRVHAHGGNDAGNEGIGKGARGGAKEDKVGTK
ncbi:hypothetical protein C8R44DRAFT_851126 [Mycena epipterygia]|nr:hypothetical protein C8R44DRAFT_851126 [Mycena epipterygia]